MTNEPENPLAFPHIVERVGFDTFKQVTSGGMTLRDYFAAAALQGLCANLREDLIQGLTFRLLSKSSYEIADVMLAAREQTRKAGE